MKEIFLVLAGMLLGGGLMAQTLADLFDQNKRQLRELGKQVAALRALSATIEEGYRETGAALDTVGGAKKADLGLHAGHFAAYKEVRPALLSNRKIETIILLGNSEDEYWLRELLENDLLGLSDADRMRLIDELYRQVKTEYLKNIQS
jgi:hypothetical protein